MLTTCQFLQYFSYSIFLHNWGNIQLSSYLDFISFKFQYFRFKQHFKKDSKKSNVKIKTHFLFLWKINGQCSISNSTVFRRSSVESVTCRKICFCFQLLSSHWLHFLGFINIFSFQILQFTILISIVFRMKSGFFSVLVSSFINSSCILLLNSFAFEFFLDQSEI